jgi:Uncharacterized protein conserved in bacteria (DUF2147)
MKRLCALMVLMVTASSAQAGTISFSVGGHRIRVEAPRDCRSSSCASISIPGVYESRSKRDDDTRNVVASPPPPAPAPVQAAPLPAPAPAPVQQSAPPAPKPIVASVPQPMPLAVYKPAAVTTQEVAPPPLPPVPQVQPATVAQPCSMPPADKADESARPTRPVLKVLREEDAEDSPIGDWQTEGKGMVRIAECGRALCGYAIREGEDEKGEAILINMKSKSDERWSGSVYSKDSGDTYYGTMRLRGPNTLHVEACAFSRFYCNGNNWTRITRPVRMMTSRQTTPEPRS